MSQHINIATVAYLTSSAELKFHIVVIIYKNQLQVLPINEIRRLVVKEFTAG